MNSDFRRNLKPSNGYYQSTAGKVRMALSYKRMRDEGMKKFSEVFSNKDFRKLFMANITS